MAINLRARWPARDKTNGHPAQDSAAGALRYGLAGWVAAQDAGTRSRGPPARARHLRYEERHCRRDARACERSRRSRCGLRTKSRCCGRRMKRSAASRRGRSSRKTRVEVQPSSCSSRHFRMARRKPSRKGVGEFEILVHGVAAHAGLDPARGRARSTSSHASILALETLQDPSRGITVNVGTITGGTRANVVADRASAPRRRRGRDDGGRGPARAQRSRGLRPLRPRVRLEVTGGVDRPPLERSPPSFVCISRRATSPQRSAGGSPEGAAGGGSDGNFTAALGVPTLDGLGPRGDGAHALHEHVLVEDLPWRAAFLAGLIASFV